MNIDYKALFGFEIEPYIEELAILMRGVFSSFPYLYDNDLSYDINYYRSYLDSDLWGIVLARHKNNIVGARSGFPLSARPELISCLKFKGGGDFINFLKREKDKIFFWSEIFVHKNYREKGIGSRLIKISDRQLLIKGFKYCLISQIIRSFCHPLCPEDYKPVCFKSFDYFEAPNVHLFLSWKDIDQLGPTEKPHTVWLKKLQAKK